MPKGVYKRTKKQMRFLRKRMREIRVTEYGFKKGHKINLGEKSPMWKGDKAGYSAIHKWVRSHKKIPKKCQKCGKIKKLQAANISGKYLRDIKDYLYLCAKCHVYMDGTVDNLKRGSLKQ